MKRAWVRALLGAAAIVASRDAAAKDVSGVFLLGPYLGAAIGVVVAFPSALVPRIGFWRGLAAAAILPFALYAWMLASEGIFGWWVVLTTFGLPAYAAVYGVLAWLRRSPMAGRLVLEIGALVVVAAILARVLLSEAFRACCQPAAVLLYPILRPAVWIGSAMSGKEGADAPALTAGLAIVFLVFWSGYRVYRRRRPRA